jgi:hypothetical protein
VPDLDQIKQGEQDRRGRFARGRSGNPGGRPRGGRDHVNRAARLRLAGDVRRESVDDAAKKAESPPMRPVSPKVTSVTRAPPLETRCRKGSGRARR